MKCIVYIHGKNGSAEEAEHYRPLFSGDVIGLEYTGNDPWTAGKEIYKAVTELKSRNDGIILIASSIGAYYAMNADIAKMIDHAYFISPVTDMEQLIMNMMEWADVDESELQEKGVIHTDFGEDLSWEYLAYVREHPLIWDVPTDILYGEKDHLVSLETVTAFARRHHCNLTVMENGEHWFHTEEQMEFLDRWITGMKHS